MISKSCGNDSDFIDQWRIARIKKILTDYQAMSSSELEKLLGAEDLAEARDRQIAAVEMEALRQKQTAALATAALTRVWQTSDR